jgi:hypothetical protein
MINHPNRSKRRRVRVVLSNGAGPLDETLAQETAQAAASLILATEFLYPGDTVTVSEIS